MNPLSMAELGILDWIAAHCHNSFWDAVMPFITGLGDQGILWIRLLCSGHSSSDEPLERKMDHSGCGCPQRVFPAVSLRSFSH